MSFFSYLKRFDWILISAVILLAGIGLVSLYSSSLAKGDFSNFNKQIVFLIIGISLMFLFSFFDYRILKNNPYLILFLYSLCCFALLGLFFFAPEIRGVKSWYKVGGLSIDPIEFTKIVLIILLAKYFSARHIEMYKIKHILVSGLYVLIPCVLIFFQPDLGSTLILGFIWLTILIISGIKIRHFLILCLCGVLIFSLGWSFLMKDYQKQRILSFVAPTVDPLGAGWSQTQSKIAIGSGGIFGKGIGQGSQTQYGFLPEPQTDFIFAAIAEETGFIGVSALLILFLILVWRVIKKALVCSTNFSRLFATGLAALFFCQIFINIGMNLGLLPIIGISLPFVSYGGGGLILSLIALGLLQNISSSRG
jgi:rod shape determining protein RodA